MSRIETIGNATLYLGDCRDILRTLPAESVDSIVTDPPYELGFMGKAWDGTGIANDVGMWREVLRVLKPGAHLLAFSGSRTYHRMVCAIEDAGFEIRDQIMWLYGSGFPKSLDVPKAIDKAAGARGHDGVGFNAAGVGASNGGSVFRSDHPEYVRPQGVTEAARQWQGWGTALKPAHEPIVVARKPLIGTVAANVLAHGTGALNIDGCRVGTTDEWQPSTRGASDSIGTFRTGERTTEQHALGRWPANVILDPEAGAMLDEQSGFSKSPTTTGRGAGGQHGITSPRGAQGTVPAPGDSGGASRFFYCAMAAKRDRGEGNVHPTVKPTDLMRYLVRLVTPPGGTVLDPFTGSGSTGRACALEGMQFIGCELDPAYFDIACRRIEGAQRQSRLFT